MLGLRELQRRFYRALVRPHGPAGAAALDPELLRHVHGDAVLGPGDRLDVYAGMYRARLVEVLMEDFPRVLDHLGAERFRTLAHAYLEAHPSTHPSVRHFGAAFADCLARAMDTELPPFVPDLARLEWTRLDVFDAADAATLTLDELRLIPPHEWGILRLRPIPALRFLETSWPVHEIWAAPADSPKGEWRPASCSLRIWRQDFLVYQVAMDETERAALACLQDALSFGEVCETLGRTLPAHDAAQQAGALVLRWIEDGILAARS